MSAAFKHALTNYVRRYWWMWIVLGLLQILCSALTLFDSSSKPMPVAVMFTFGASIAVSTGWLRTMCTLPLSRKEVGRFRWWAMVGIPLIVLTGATLAPLMAAPFVAAKPSLLSLITLVGRTWGALGLVMLYAELGRNLSGPSRIRSAINGLVFAIVTIGWAVLIFPQFTMFMNTEVISDLVPVFSAIGIVAGITNFFRADRYELSRPIVRSAATKKTYTATRDGMSGWPAIIKPQAVIAAFGLGIMAFIFVIFLMGAPEPVVVISATLGSAVVGFIQPMMWMPAARAFRSLPLTAGHLALALFVVGSVPTIFFAGIYYATAMIPSKWILPSLLMPLCYVATGIPIALRVGYRPVLNAFATMLLMFAMMLVPVIVAKVFAITTSNIMSPRAVAIEIGIGAAIIAASWFWTRYELISGLHAYRPRPTPHTSFGGGLQPQ